MCGRYTLATDLEELIEVFEVPPTLFAHQPRYNIAPTQTAPVVAQDRKGRRMGLMRWGLIPYWAKDPAIGNRHINARSETVRERPAFRDAFSRRRCLVPADGFYEWQRADGPRRPFWIHPVDGAPLSFAGLWERWRPPDGDDVFSFTILTTDASDPVRPVHDRMPAIIPPSEREVWLSRDSDPETLTALLGPYAEGLQAREVSTWVNRPDHDDPTCIEPTDEAG